VTWTSVRPWLGTVARLVLGVVWIWASLSKLTSPRTFVQAVRAYDATPEWLSKGIGYGLPVLELAIGVLLVVGISVRISAAVSALLLLVFLIGLIQAAARDLQLECGCFGGGGTTDNGTSYTLDILRDVGLLVLAVFLVIWSFTRISLEEFLARNDTVVMPSAKRMRTPEGRRKYEAQLAVARSAARDRSRYVDGSLALVVVLVTVIGIGVQAGRAKIEGDLTAVNASVSDGVVFGKKAAATVDIYEDFGCPVCLQFEKSTHAWFQDAVRANLAQARYHTISILDSRSPNKYSTRAANAALCASDGGPDEFLAYHDLLYGAPNGKQFQPQEGTSGPSDQKLIKLAQDKSMGLKPADITTFTTCVGSEQHKALVEAMTEQASKDGVNATPTVLVNGKQIDATLAALKAAIAKADAAGPAPQPSKTPSPTPSTSASSSVSASPTPSPSAAPTPSGSTSAG
jgi:protein-disulfide isomerase